MLFILDKDLKVVKEIDDCIVDVFHIEVKNLNRVEIQNFVNIICQKKVHKKVLDEDNKISLIYQN